VKPRFNGWTFLGALAFAGVLFAATLVALWAFGGAKAEAPAATAGLTLIPASTATPPGMNSMFFTATPSMAAPVGPNGIGVGVYVQISGTEGEGLRVRTAPGTASDVRFLALDAEVFKVIEGPKMADDYTWWYLEAPYDQTRSGWAAANFLTVVDTQP
jgi:hypothetical protein